MSDAPKKRINSRSKGQRGERQVVDLLQPIVDDVRLSLKLDPITLKRNALQSHQGGEDIVGIVGMAVEVKFVEVENFEKWWEQAERQAAAKQCVPLLFFRASKQKWRGATFTTVLGPCGNLRGRFRVIMDETSFLQWFKLAYTEILLYFLRHSPVLAKVSQI